MHQVVLYSGPGCGLCIEAARTLEVMRRALDFELREVSIDTDEELQRRYLLEIPVIEVDGAVVTSGRIQYDAVRRALTR